MSAETFIAAFVALALGIGILALAAFWVGDRQ
jgi:hypothetical protein